MRDRRRTTRRAAARALLTALLFASTVAAATDEPGAPEPLTLDWRPGLEAQTDAPVYYRDGLRPDGSLGTATLRNILHYPAYLPGCSQFSFEQQTAAGTWQSHGPQIVCVWEGSGQKLVPGASVAFHFGPPGLAGTWRIGFAVSIGCQDGKPLSEAACHSAADIYTPPFLVRDSRADDPAGGLAPSIELGMDRPGGDYASFDLDADDPRACQASCLAADRCLAWTYVNPGVQGSSARCWLKSQVPVAVANSCCVSGVRAPGTPPDDTGEAACEAAGGTWGPGGLLPDPLCFSPQLDAGKPCDRAGQCGGHCLLADPSARVDGMPGQCSSVEPMFGCFDYLDEGGRQAGICID